MKNHLRLFQALLAGGLLCAGSSATAAIVTVAGFTDDAVRAAVNSASPGDVVFLPAGDYLFDATVSVNKTGLTIRGAADLLNVGVVEPGPADTPPVWSAAPSRCYAPAGNLNLVFFTVAANNVTFQNLKIEGNITHTSGSGQGIYVSGRSGLTVEHCELVRHMVGVAIFNTQNAVVRRSYFRENYRDGMGYGVEVIGVNMDTGGSTAKVYENEFTLQRHDIASNSPLTHFTFERNYCHDNDSSQKQPSVDMHPQGRKTISCVVRDNIFENTRPGGIRAGIMEWTSNTMDEACEVKQNVTVVMNEPIHNGNIIPDDCIHDVYMGENISPGDTPLARPKVYNFPPQKYVSYSLFLEGQLWEAANTDYPPYEQGIRPMVGHIYWTAPGSATEIRDLRGGEWHDLHVMAVDPQGHANLAEIGIQIRNATQFPYKPGNSGGAFDPAGDFYLRLDATSVKAREGIGSGDWSDITGRAGLYADAGAYSWAPAGDHRIHAVVRVKLPAQPPAGADWQLQGYTLDKEGNRPVDIWFAGQDGWSFTLAPGDTAATSWKHY